MTVPRIRHNPPEPQPPMGASRYSSMVAEELVAVSLAGAFLGAALAIGHVLGWW